MQFGDESAQATFKQLIPYAGISIFFVNPVAVGNTSPVNVCTRTGTRHIHAAIIESKPALGVIECTIVGLS